MTKENLIEGILSLETLEDIDDIIDAIKSARKAVNDKEIALKKHLFRKGQKVNVVEKTKTTKGIILKVNKTRCDVDMNGMTYAVPISMLEVAS